jgi:hypothetical protein
MVTELKVIMHYQMQCIMRSHRFTTFTQAAKSRRAQQIEYRQLSKFFISNCIPELVQRSYFSKISAIILAQKLETTTFETFSK